MSDDAKLDDFVESQPDEENSVKHKKKMEVEIPPKTVELPYDWELMELQETGDLKSSNVDKKSRDSETPVELCNYMDVYNNEYITNELNFMRATASEREIERFLLDEGDVIFTKDSEEKFDIAVPAVVQDKLDNVLCGYHLFLIKPDNETAHSAYLSKSLQHYAVSSHLGSRANGTTRFGLTVSSTERAKVPIPPLPEQRKIATVLYNVDQAIQKTQEVVEQANQLKKGFIQQFYSRGYYDHQEWQQVDMQDAYVMTRTDELPAAWDIKKSGDIAEVKTGHTPSTSVDEYWDGEISWVDIHDLTQLEGTAIHSTDDTITEEGLNNSGAKLLPEGTLVLCRTGAIGETAILGKEMATDQDQVTFECDESELLPRYLMYLFEYATPQLERLSAGSTHDKVQLHFFSDLEIPLPEIDEQREIVDVLKSVDEVSQANKEQLDNLHRVKRGLMQDLLSGTVRTTDTNIEVPNEIAQYG